MGEAFPLGASTTVKLKARNINDSTLVIDEDADVLDEATGSVQYDWQPADVDTAGQFKAWWQLTFADTTTVDTPEFDLVILDHSPGVLAHVGAIYRRAKAIIPITWSALANSPDYGGRAATGTHRDY
jgi:hypothetical protein